MIEQHRTGALRRAALVGLVAGAVGSVGLMLRAGQSAPRLLQILFTGWVLSPFVVLAGADVVSKRWSALTRATLHIVTLVVALATLALYGFVALGPAREKNAPVFVLTPPLSWLLVAVALSTTAFISARRSRSMAP
jgi:cation transport ATPase